MVAQKIRNRKRCWSISKNKFVLDFRKSQKGSFKAHIFWRINSNQPLRDVVVAVEFRIRIWFSDQEIRASNFFPRLLFVSYSLTLRSVHERSISFQFRSNVTERPNSQEFCQTNSSTGHPRQQNDFDEKRTPDLRTKKVDIKPSSHTSDMTICYRVRYLVALPRCSCIIEYELLANLCGSCWGTEIILTQRWISVSSCFLITTPQSQAHLLRNR